MLKKKIIKIVTAFGFSVRWLKCYIAVCLDIVNGTSDNVHNPKLVNII